MYAVTAVPLHFVRDWYNLNLEAVKPKTIYKISPNDKRAKKKKKPHIKRENVPKTQLY